MKPLVEYMDYRRYIRDFYTERKTSSGFTWRDFAKLAGYASGSYLKLVCDGKTRLTTAGATKTASAMGLAGFDQDYFVLMVNYNDAKDWHKRKKAFEKMIAVAASHKEHVAVGESFSYFESWKNPVLRELLPAMPGATDDEIARCCYPKITAAEVAAAANFLKEQGLLVVDNDENYHQTDRILTTGVLDKVPEAVHSMQLQMAEFAIRALNELLPQERDFSGVTFGATRKAYAKILEETAKFRRKVIAIATADDETEQVFRLNLQLFPLTRPAGELKKEEK